MHVHTLFGLLGLDSFRTIFLTSTTLLNALFTVSTVPPYDATSYTKLLIVDATIRGDACSAQIAAGSPQNSRSAGTPV